MDLVDKLLDTDLPDFIDKYFNGNVKTFFTFLTKKGIFDDLAEHLMSNEYGNEVLNYYYEKNPQKTIDLITKEYFTDVEKDGNRYWMSLDRDELANLFDTDRWGGGAQWAAERILSDDYTEFTNYVDFDDLYNEVISNLDPENIKRLKEVVYEEIKDLNLEFDGETLNTKEKVMSLTDKELSELIDEENLDVKSELSNLYSSSYEYAFQDEVYDLVMGELKGLFGLENFSRETPSKKRVYDKTTQGIKLIDTTQHQVDVTNLIPDVVSKVIGYGGYNSDNDFEYYGSFIGVLRFMMGEEEEYLDFRVPEYADWDLTKKNMNEMFNDYI